MAQPSFFEHAPAYRFDGELGCGAYATVFRAFDVELRAPVAVKQIGAVKKLTPDAAARREFRITQAFQHPNIVRALDCITLSEDSSSYIVFDFANQGDLYDRVEPSAHAALGRAQAVLWARELASALSHVHSKGYVHRDVKPENVLLHDGHAKLCDFGLAIRAESRLRGRCAGTGAYMAPEIIAGETSGKPYSISTASDVWSFGIVLYALLFADLPWETASADDEEYSVFLASGGVMGPTYPYERLSSPMRRLLSKLLAPNPHHRCTMAEAASALRNLHIWFADEEEDSLLGFSTKCGARYLSTPKAAAPQANLVAMTSLSLSADSLDSLVDDAAAHFESIRF